MQYKLRKKDYDLYLANINSILSIADGFTITGDCLHPFILDEENHATVNGLTVIRSFFPEPLEQGVTMISVIDLPEIINELKQKSHIKELNLIVDEKGMCIQTDDEWNVLAVVTTDVITFPKGYSDFEYMIKSANYDTSGIYDLSTKFSDQELDDARSSKPVTLETEYGKVRISRNLFPLTGPLRKTGPIPFESWWNMHQITMENGTIDHVLSLYVKYRRLEAIHLYSVTPY